MTLSVRLSWSSLLLIASLSCLFCAMVSFTAAAQEFPPPESSTNAHVQTWNWHVQNTDIVQADPGFSAKYSGPASLNSTGNLKETISADLFAGVRLWRDAEVHMDGLMWQGFGLSTTHGIESFPDGDAYKAGTRSSNLMFARLFLRETIGLGGKQEEVPDDQLTLAGQQDISRLTFTIGRFTPLDIIDHNTYAQDAHTQFMSWGLVANLAWDYGQDTIGYTTGFSLELNQLNWALRYVCFSMPPYINSGRGQGSGDSGDDQYLTWPARGKYGEFFHSWSMAAEFERRYHINARPGAIRFLSYLNQGYMDSYHGATVILRARGAGADISAAQAYRYKYGFGLNWEQEVATNVGVFSRLGWNDGQTQAMEFSDANWTASLGLSVKGQRWRRPGDTFGIAGIVSGASRSNQKFLEAGGLGILAGDGRLTYGSEKVLETFYDVQIWKTVHAAVDYQFISNPAFNRDRGPVSVFLGRLHWEL